MPTAIPHLSSLIRREDVWNFAEIEDVVDILQEQLILELVVVEEEHLIMMVRMLLKMMMVRMLLKMMMVRMLLKMMMMMSLRKSTPLVMSVLNFFKIPFRSFLQSLKLSRKCLF